MELQRNVKIVMKDVKNTKMGGGNNSVHGCGKGASVFLFYPKGISFLLEPGSQGFCCPV